MTAAALHLPALHLPAAGNIAAFCVFVLALVVGFLWHEAVAR